ncbi:MAG: hypothetical protein WAL66_03690, partial [Nitrososphaeraceae archaeon]
VYSVIPATPATGILYITQNNPEFISGHIRMRGRNGGQYPFNYLEMIDTLFGKEDNTIEVCSGNVKEDCFTVDINPDTKPNLVSDGQKLDGIPNGKFSRWRCDPPYNSQTAKLMYRTALPNTIRLLNAGARVCKGGSLMFLLLGPTNYQWHPAGVKRIGYVNITVVPNNENRALNIFYKYADA